MDLSVFSNEFSINVLNENDAPAWKSPLPSIVMEENSTQTFNAPSDAKVPAAKSNESPGRKGMMTNPVSTKMTSSPTWNSTRSIQALGADFQIEQTYFTIAINISSDACGGFVEMPVDCIVEHNC